MLQLLIVAHRPITLVHQLSTAVDSCKDLLAAAPIDSISVSTIVIYVTTVRLGEQSLALVVASLGLAAPIATGDPRVHHHVLLGQVLLGQLNGPKTLRCAGSCLCRGHIIMITAFIICFQLLSGCLEFTIDQGVALIELLASVSHVIWLISLYSCRIDSVK